MGLDILILPVMLVVKITIGSTKTFMSVTLLIKERATTIQDNHLLKSRSCRSVYCAPPMINIF